MALQQQCQVAGIPSILMSLLPIPNLTASYDIDLALAKLSAGSIAIFAGGTGNPWCTTDSAAAQRAVDIKADIILKATKVEGVYSADPLKHPDATFYSHLNYDKVLSDNLRVMDRQAFEYCRQHRMPIRIFNMNQPKILQRVITGEECGTLINHFEMR